MSLYDVQGAQQIELELFGVLDFRFSVPELVFLGIDGRDSRFDAHELLDAPALEHAVHADGTFAAIGDSYSERGFLFDAESRSFITVELGERLVNFEKLTIIPSRQGFCFVTELAIRNVANTGELVWAQFPTRGIWEFDAASNGYVALRSNEDEILRYDLETGAAT